MALTNPQETIDERPTCCEYAAGRMFYGAKNNVYYSQVMEGESIDKLSRCYQQNDPTSQRLSDLLETDGGTIQIDNATDIIQIKKFRNGVMLYSANGVWYLSGPEKGFNATNFSLDQVSNAGCISPQSVVQVEDSHYYWSSEGIYVIATNQFGEAETTSIIEGSMQSFYNDIAIISKKKVTGVYNKIKKQVEWHYGSDTQTGATEYKCATDKSFLLDLREGGIWPQEYEATLTEALGQFIAGGVNTTQGTEDYDTVKLVITLGSPSSTQNYSIDFGVKNDTDFQDFSVNIPTAYMETGYESLDKPSNKKTVPYISTHFLQTEENWVSDGAGGFKLDLQSGCQMRAKWDWNNSTDNGRWSPAQQAYRFRRTYIPTGLGTFDSGEKVITTKNKMLGRGQALSIRFEQEANKDMQLLGYTSQFSIKGKM
ncbi:MAG: hypothetical protein OCD76_07350 [Reichenbachiella sp.]